MSQCSTAWQPVFGKLIVYRIINFYKVGIILLLYNIPLARVREQHAPLIYAWAHVRSRSVTRASLLTPLAVIKDSCPPVRGTINT